MRGNASSAVSARQGARRRLECGVGLMGKRLECGAERPSSTKYRLFCRERAPSAVRTAPARGGFFGPRRPDLHYPENGFAELGPLAPHSGPFLDKNPGIWSSCSSPHRTRGVFAQTRTALEAFPDSLPGQHRTRGVSPQAPHRTRDASPHPAGQSITRDCPLLCVLREGDISHGTVRVSDRLRRGEL